MCVVSVLRSPYHLTLSESPVYEYSLQGQWIMMDMDDGYILWTGIWKGLSEWLSIVRRISNTPNSALGHSKGSLDELPKGDTR